MEVNKEEHTSQAKTKPSMETYVEKQDDPETEETKYGTTHNNLIPLSVPPRGPAPNHEPCDQKYKTPVGSAAQLISPGLLAPDTPGPQDREVLPNKE